MKFFAILLSLPFAGVLVSNHSTPSHDDSAVSPVTSVMLPGEELVYEVRWTFFKLGKIRVVLSQPKTPDAVYSSVAYSDSYDLPFVDFHAFSTSEMDSTLFTKGASLFEKKDDKWFRQVYYFTTSTRMYVTENSLVKDIQSPPMQPPTFDTLKLSYDRFQDGTSILYFARAHAHDQRAIAVPTLVRGKAGKTNFYFPAEPATEKIDAVGYPIKVLEMEGKAEFEGIFGLTGDFTGWFTDDEAAVPVKAKMKVILGSITLELKEWKRRGWSPPKAD
jgi:hypothetical protein